MTTNAGKTQVWMYMGPDVRLNVAHKMVLENRRVRTALHQEQLKSIYANAAQILELNSEKTNLERTDHDKQ